MSIQFSNLEQPHPSTPKSPPSARHSHAWHSESGSLESGTAGLFLLLLYTFYVYNLLQQPDHDWVELSTMTQSIILGGFVVMVGIWRYLVYASNSWPNVELGVGTATKKEGEQEEMQLKRDDG